MFENPRGENNRLQCLGACIAMVRVREVLLAARETLSTGWSEGLFFVNGKALPSDPEIGVSTLEALALHGTYDEQRAAEEMLRIDVAPKGETTLSRWLESPGRTHEEVMALFSRAAQRAQTQTAA